jgi:hypothetical protein
MVLALKRPRERSLKEGNGVKKYLTLVVFLFFLLGTTHASHALIYKFDETVIGVPFSATMEILVSEKTLTINLINTSTSPSYNPNIWGFGVSLLNSNAVATGLSWVLKAGGTDVSENWQKTSLTYGTSTLYRPYFLAFSEPNGLYKSTSASLVMTFSEDPRLNESVAPIIRVGNISASNPQFVTGSLVATPEPGTLLLLGIGLVGIGLIMREML